MKYCKMTWMNFKIMLSISSQTKKGALQKLFLYETLENVSSFL